MNTLFIKNERKTAEISMLISQNIGKIATQLYKKKTPDKKLFILLLIA